MWLHRAIASFLLVGIGLSSADAVLLNFDEFDSPTTFTNGQSFSVSDAFGPSAVAFQSVPLIGAFGFPESTPVTIGLPENVGFSGSRPLGSTANVIYPRSVVADFAGSVGRRSTVSIQFFNSGGTVNLGVNGSAPLVERGNGVAAFQAFDGATIGGVAVSVFDFGSGRGRIDLTGLIDSVLFGGQEAIFDAIRTTAAPIGDYDGDGAVGPEDYTVWREQYGSVGNNAADGNGDSVVDAADYTVWADRYVASETASVPEPGVFVLGLTAAALLPHRRRGVVTPCVSAR